MAPSPPGHLPACSVADAPVAIDAGGSLSHLRLRSPRDAQPLPRMRDGRRHGSIARVVELRLLGDPWRLRLHVAVEVGDVSPAAVPVRELVAERVPERAVADVAVLVVK